jgi:GTPase SAR1 family protein
MSFQHELAFPLAPNAKYESLLFHPNPCTTPAAAPAFFFALVPAKKNGPQTTQTSATVTDGQESFRAITRSYYRGAGGALLVFSLTSHQSFTNCRGWLADLRQWGEEDLLVLLVGNKGDVLSTTEEGTGGAERREVEREEAERWAEEEGLAGYVETSAKSGAGVEEVRRAGSLFFSLNML